MPYPLQTWLSNLLKSFFTSIPFSHILLSFWELGQPNLIKFMKKHPTTLWILMNTSTYLHDIFEALTMVWKSWFRFFVTFGTGEEEVNDLLVGFWNRQTTFKVRSNSTHFIAWIFYLMLCFTSEWRRNLLISVLINK